jgi:hypothetical protein
MKKHLFILPILGITLFACQTEQNPEESPEKPALETIEAPEIVSTSYKLLVEKSTIKWDRKLDQKSMKRTMKILGADVQVDMEAVTLNMSGNVTPKSGSLITADDVPESGDLFFDMQTFKFAEEKGNGLFDTKKYPTSELKFLSFQKDKIEGSYKAKCELTIQGHMEEVTIPITVSSADGGLKLAGSFTFNTLKFPLRAPDQQATINTDEITVKLNIFYGK